ncbi:hypothetical protein [uncultured Erythrobacter sp.]|uniref:hypothetical protein n=1 Tax=uncultured Erythrobacter sp. TaxID=263913 RepID=UPI0026195E78|nr:hypothetical protein [uncultured Erythrobacter sp.]
MTLPSGSNIAIARRVGLDQTITNDLVAEIVQRRRATSNGQSFDFFGGATIIMDYEGKVRFAVRKRVNNNARVHMQADFIAGTGAAFWESADSMAKPVEAMMQALCASQ